MQDGWYCRSIANMQANEAANVSNASGGEHSRSHDQRKRKHYSSESSGSDTEPEPNYQLQYQGLKKKLKFLIYENECFQDALRSSQKRLLKVCRDRSFLLDRLLELEKPESTSSDTDETESSDDGASYNNVDVAKKKKNDISAGHQPMSNPGSVIKNVNNAIKRKRAVAPKKTSNANHPLQGTAAVLAKASPAIATGVSASDGHMTPEEVERHLQSRQSYLELLPERAPPTVPTEMFSNDPSLDSESNDVLENSPNVEEWFD